MNKQILDEDFHRENSQNTFDAETITQINLAKIEINDHCKKVRAGRNVLIILAVLSLVSLIAGVYYSVQAPFQSEIVLEGGLMLLLYAACAAGVYYNPRVALILGLSIYLILVLLSGLIDSGYIFRGIIWKVIIISFLARGIHSAFRIKKHTKELFQLGVPMEELNLIKKLKHLPHTLRPGE